MHFISRTLTDVEKRYSQTEKDALCVKWAKDIFSIQVYDYYSTHKPLLTLFNKPTAKLPPLPPPPPPPPPPHPPPPPPRIKKWVMDMQDVDFEMKYEPGKDEADHLDFLSKHPLPVVGNNDTEKILKASIGTVCKN